jgi:hypothetical protein
MIVHEESETAFISTKGGELAIVDISSVRILKFLMFLDSSNDQTSG